MISIFSRCMGVQRWPLIVTVSPSPVSPIFTVRRHRFHRSSPFTVTGFIGLHWPPSPVFTVHCHRSHPVGERSYPYQTWCYQVTGNRVTEVSAIRFLTKVIQYSLSEGLLGRRIWICYRFLEVVDLVFSVRKGYFNKITIFHKVWSNVIGVEKFESVIGFSPLLTWCSQ